MELHNVEMEIFSCPFTKSSECSGRLDCYPIPGFGTEKPEFLVLGENPAIRNRIWQRCKSIKAIQQLYFH